MHPVAPQVSWSPGQPRLLQEGRALALWLRGKSFPPLTKLAGVASRHTGLYAPMLNKHPSIPLSYSLSRIPLFRDFSRFLFSCSPMLGAPLQIGSFSFASALQWFPCSDYSPCSPLKGEEILLTVPFSIGKAHLPTLSRFGRLTLLLHSCQAKTRVITQKLSHIHHPHPPVFF